MLVLKPAKKGGKKLPPYTWKYIDADKRPFVNYEAFIYAFECPFFLPHAVCYMTLGSSS